MKPDADSRPILPFRVHFDNVTLPPFDIDARDPAEVRERMKRIRPGQPINKIKLIKEQARG